MHNWLVVMVKQPRAGAVKTRLGTGLGTVRATMLYRHLVAGAVRRLARPAGWQLAAAVTPDGTGDDFPALAGVEYVIDQGGGDLGARMQRMFDAMPPGPVVIIGSDIPDISGSDIGRAFGALGRADVVVGPAGDGGYWLIGLAGRARHLALFGDVRWSGPHALGDTLANVPAHCRVARLRVLGDLDRPEDFIAWTRAGGRLSR